MNKKLVLSCQKHHRSVDTADAVELYSQQNVRTQGCVHNI